MCPKGNLASMQKRGADVAWGRGRASQGVDAPKTTGNTRKGVPNEGIQISGALIQQAKKLEVKLLNQVKRLEAKPMQQTK
ncbi:hypothetical protein C1H46_019996 [Malus baccata]|uniref:Uncharacterized protein n=1 Tax=Malus baccata TaxID=106549 RepID=A0A540M6R2_MALBA|nr:hypothetical protein C1H46_019996 [Malus baccata]